MIAFHFVLKLSSLLRAEASSALVNGWELTLSGSCRDQNVDAAVNSRSIGGMTAVLEVIVKLSGKMAVKTCK